MSAHVHPVHIHPITVRRCWLEPEESNLRQQSENPYSTAKCKGNIPWMPRLEEQRTQVESLVESLTPTDTGRSLISVVTWPCLLRWSSEC